mgnify:CR=1 FL=1
MRTELLDLLAPSAERLHILIVDGSEHLAQLRELYPNAEIHAVTPYVEVAAHEGLAALGVHMHVLDWRRDPLPFAEETFDRIIAEFAIEYAYEPYDALMALNRALRETGTLYTCYTNIRYHRVLAALRAGEFRVCGVRHLYVKPEIVRLLNDTLYKEIHFFAGERDDDPSVGEAWAEEGFANVSDDLTTRTWLIRASRSTAENLKLFFAQDVRKRIARLLQRIEYDVDARESAAELRDLCAREGVFADYLSDFITEVCVHDGRVRRVLNDLLAE